MISIRKVWSNTNDSPKRIEQDSTPGEETQKHLNSKRKAAKRTNDEFVIYPSDCSRESPPPHTQSHPRTEALRLVQRCDWRLCTAPPQCRKRKAVVTVSTRRLRRSMGEKNHQITMDEWTRRRQAVPEWKKPVPALALPRVAITVPV